MKGVSRTIHHDLNGIAHYFAGCFIFPGTSLLQWPTKGDRSRVPAIHDTASAIPAFIRMQNDRRISFFGIGNKDIHLTDINTGIASCAEFGIENYRGIRRSNIRQSAYFDLSHFYYPL
jgi:hypothetical protein